MMTKTRLRGAAAALGLCSVVALAGATEASAAPAPRAAASVQASPQTATQTTSGFRCTSVFVPGTNLGTFEHCVNFALSKNARGQWVSIPYQCKGTNHSGGTLQYYREAQYGPNNALYGEVDSPGLYLTNGQVELWTCSPNFAWIPIGNTHYVRASVQELGTTQTAGANVSSAW